uniref:Uncharacterized protein n=1 Tax=Sinocyclocheilus grahami TaxID=75366 RepID=A0A672S442_SINGR
MLSSEPSSQSGSPSHCHLLGTHWPLRHTKSTSAQVFLTEPVSSLPSEQSRSPSHYCSHSIREPVRQKEVASVACFSQSCSQSSDSSEYLISASSQTDAENAEGDLI